MALKTQQGGRLEPAGVRALGIEDRVMRESRGNSRGITLTALTAAYSLDEQVAMRTLR